MGEDAARHDGRAERERMVEVLGTGLHDNLADGDEHATGGVHRQAMASYQGERREHPGSAQQLRQPRMADHIGEGEVV